MESYAKYESKEWKMENFSTLHKQMIEEEKEIENKQKELKQKKIKKAVLKPKKDVHTRAWAFKDDILWTD